MARRATAVTLEDRFHVVAGEPILDTQEGVLIIAFDDGTSRTFNWDKVVDYYYYMTEDEYEQFRRERGAE
ncbi:Hypothetical Protein PBI_L5_47 [Fromanvirus L5]|uniref:Gene 47 protein n=1 Tax=Mycobacterium phage L5 TaxID=31757 RepID=VG47_BPML5|nr:Hypothetical Protein PBI_L5_47 [Fromanvirus L5]Q05258.1 RecName: Full=Gene 47 protein; AltName: Full=Gp47 [Fromanvirus L5]CAA79423.1 Hypothetical Protein PBI_L5_47 [Fromanvirus L5]